MRNCKGPAGFNLDGAIHGRGAQQRHLQRREGRHHPVPGRRRRGVARQPDRQQHRLRSDGLARRHPGGGRRQQQRHLQQHPRLRHGRGLRGADRHRADARLQPRLVVHGRDRLGARGARRRRRGAVRRRRGRRSAPRVADAAGGRRPGRRQLRRHGGASHRRSGCAATGGRRATTSARTSSGRSRPSQARRVRAAGRLRGDGRPTRGLGGQRGAAGAGGAGAAGAGTAGGAGGPGGATSGLTGASAGGCGCRAAGAGAALAGCLPCDLVAGPRFVAPAPVAPAANPRIWPARRCERTPLRSGA